MSDEFEIIDDEDQTLAVEDDEFAVSDDLDAEEEEFEDEEEDDFGYENKYAPVGPEESADAVYPVMLVLTLVAYLAAVVVVVAEMKTYCDPNEFPFNLFN